MLFFSSCIFFQNVLIMATYPFSPQCVCIKAVFFHTLLSLSLQKFSQDPPGQGVNFTWGPRCLGAFSKDSGYAETFSYTLSSYIWLDRSCWLEKRGSCLHLISFFKFQCSWPKYPNSVAFLCHWLLHEVLLFYRKHTNVFSGRLQPFSFYLSPFWWVTVRFSRSVFPLAPVFSRIWVDRA